MKKWFNKKSRMIIGASIIFFIVLMALFAPFLAPENPYGMQLEKRYEAPSFENPFGRDQNGSCVFSKILYGARISLFVALTVVSISVTIGLLFGSIAGFWGGAFDLLLMRLIDIVYAFPGFLLAMSLVAVMGPSIYNLIFALSITGWSGYARLIRGEILLIKTKDFVTASQALGAGSIRLVVQHIWPNLLGPLFIQATFGLAGTIIAESGLSFLGLGVPPSEPTWGSLLNAGRKALIEAPHLSLFPGFMIFLIVLGFNFLGDGLRDYLDPKSK